jgi:SpoU rRNA methylase family enzyme
MHEVAQEAEKKLEQKIDPNSERIEKELVEVVRTVQGLRKKLSKLKKQEMEYEDYLMNSRDEMMGR